MRPERAFFFLDYANINRAATDLGLELNYSELLAYMGEGRFLVESHVYVPKDPRNEYRLDPVIEALWSQGYMVHQKLGTVDGDSYKCNFDIEIAMDILRTVYQARPDIIVLGSGDGDFIPLLMEVRRLGVRVEVASFQASASRELLLKSSGYINLDEYVADELLGATPSIAIPEQYEADIDFEAPEDVESEEEPAYDPETEADTETSGADIARSRAGSVPTIPDADDY